MYFDDDDDEHDPLYGFLPDLAPPKPEDEAAFRANQAAEVPRPPPPVQEPEPIAEPEPEPAPQPTAAPPLEQHAEEPLPPSLVDREANGAYAFEPPDPDPPKSTSLLDDEGAQWAALFDTFLNGGRGVGKILGAAAVQKSKKKSEALDNDYKQAQIDHLRGTGGMTELQRRRLELQAEGQGLVRDREGRLWEALNSRTGELRRKQDPNAASAVATRDVLREKYPDRFHPGDAMDKAGPEALDRLKPVISQEASVALGPAKNKTAAEKKAMETDARIQAEVNRQKDLDALAGSKAKATAQGTDEGHLANTQELARQRAAGTQAGQGDLKERAFYLKAGELFRGGKDEKADLDMVGILDNLDQTEGGIVPKDMAERLAQNSTIAERYVDKSRLPVVAGKRMLLEVWSRGQTGAASTTHEEERFRAQVANQFATASDEAIEAAYNQLRDIVQKRVAGKAVGNPAAVDIMKLIVRDPYSWLSVTPEQAQAWNKPSVDPAASPQTKQTYPASPAAPHAPTPRQTAAGQEQTQLQPPPQAPLPQPDPAAHQTDDQLAAQELKGLLGDLPVTSGMPDAEDAAFEDAITNAPPHARPNPSRDHRRDKSRPAQDKLDRANDRKPTKRKSRADEEAEELMRRMMH